MAKPASHIHRYQRTKLGDNFIVYRCMLPGCAHYIRKELIMGKLCNCYRCGEDFIIGKKEMRRVRPHCGCVQRAKPDIEMDKMRQFLEESNV